MCAGSIGDQDQRRVPVAVAVAPGRLFLDLGRREVLALAIGRIGRSDRPYCPV